MTVHSYIKAIQFNSSTNPAISFYRVFSAVPFHKSSYEGQKNKRKNFRGGILIFIMKRNTIYQGNSLEVLKTLPDNSIDCCVTSPPYWGLRNYGHDEQLGSEKHYQTFIDNLCNIFDAVKRILKPEGTCFVNLGDSYSSDTKGGGGTHYPDGTPYKQTTNKGSRYGITKFDSDLPNKCLCMIPERFAIEMVSRGWILRNQIIWHKPNQMPSSATDRFTVDFEKIFFFVKQQKYYFEQQLEKSLWAEFDNRSKVKGGG